MPPCQEGPAEEEDAGLLPSAPQAPSPMIANALCWLKTTLGSSSELGDRTGNCSRWAGPPARWQRGVLLGLGCRGASRPAAELWEGLPTVSSLPLGQTTSRSGSRYRPSGPRARGA